MAVLAAVVVTSACFIVFGIGYVTGLYVRPSAPVPEQRQGKTEQRRGDTEQRQGKTKQTEEERLQKQVENIMNYIGSERGQQGIDE